MTIITASDDSNSPRFKSPRQSRRRHAAGASDRPIRRSTPAENGEKTCAKTDAHHHCDFCNNMLPGGGIPG
ncbi:hypothetical protein [Bradyrhizobium nanningense]|uniref:hypothetical protein n=1 Tax=Bradyrhizobium nanningense TaxID=1325118 RepID=UPI001008BBDE|nr:hypothetical protein [Bradyrhizobium nanningense]